MCARTNGQNITLCADKITERGIVYKEVSPLAVLTYALVSSPLRYILKRARATSGL